MVAVVRRSRRGALRQLLLLACGLSLVWACTEGAPSAGPAQELVYQTVSSFEYEGAAGAYRMRTDGALAVKRALPELGTATYDFAFNAAVAVPGYEGVLGLESQRFRLHRDPGTQRFHDEPGLLSSPAALGNLALAQLVSEPLLDGRYEDVEFRFESPLLPERVRFSTSGVRRETEALGPVVVLDAQSGELVLQTPEGARLRGRLEVLCVADAELDRVFLKATSLRLTSSTDPGGQVVMRSLLVLSDEDGAIDLSELTEHLRSPLELLEGERGEPKAPLLARLPTWALQAPTLHDAAAVVAAVAMEGKPNPVVTVTIGMILLADSAISAGTQLAEQAGWIEDGWDGLANHAGQGLGLGAAKLVEARSGQQVDEQLWQDVGGGLGDLGVAFLPSGALGAGIKVSGSSLKVVQGVQLAGRSLHLSSSGMKLVTAGKGWIHSARTYDVLSAALKGVQAAKAGWQLTDASFASAGRVEPSRAVDAAPLLLRIPEDGRDPTPADLVRNAAGTFDQELLVVLLWDQPGTDVDLYVTDPIGDTTWFRSMAGSSGLVLDVDDRDGLGPEQVSLIPGRGPSRVLPGTYRVRAHCYDDGVSGSGATGRVVVAITPSGASVSSVFRVIPFALASDDRRSSQPGQAGPSWGEIADVDLAGERIELP